MKTLEVAVIYPGSEISTLDGGLKGHVTSVIVDSFGVKYLFGYFCEGEYKETWLYPYQFKVLD